MVIIKRLKFLIKEFLNLINLEINLNPKNFKIRKANYNFKPEKKYKFLIPPLKLNYNYNSSIINYKKNFLNAAFKTYFPTILEFQKKINYKSNKNFFLDLGCGFGPMAAAYLNYVNMKKSKKINYNYIGVDINEIAISWLNDKYKDKKIFNFILHNTELSKDYLQSKSKGIKTDADSDASEVEYKIPENFKCDIQWSWSYFTHLTPESCKKVLKLVNNVAEKDSLQFNSWLIFDDESSFALESGLANRILPYDMGSYLTRSKENPLTATCYKKEFIEEIYNKSGLEIIKVIKGNWTSTNTIEKNYNINQDLIISKKN